MMKAEPVADVTRNTHNYFAQGGNELVIGGKLTFLPGAITDLAGGYAPAYAVFAVMLLYSLFMLQSTYRLAKV